MHTQLATATVTQMQTAETEAESFDSILSENPADAAANIVVSAILLFAAVASTMFLT